MRLGIVSISSTVALVVACAAKNDARSSDLLVGRNAADGGSDAGGTFDPEGSGGAGAGGESSIDKGSGGAATASGGSHGTIADAATANGGSHGTIADAAAANGGSHGTIADAAAPVDDRRDGGTPNATAADAGDTPTDAGSLVPGALTALTVPDQLTGITQAVWSDSLRAYFLLQPAGNSFYQVKIGSNAPEVAGPYPLPAGEVAPHFFAVSDTRLFAVVDGAIQRVPATGTTASEPVPLAGSPVPGSLRGAYARGTLLIGDASGPAQVLSENDLAARPLDVLLDGGAPATTWSYGIERLATNGTSFAIENPVGNQRMARVVDPSTFVVGATGCPIYFADTPLAFMQDTLAWVTQPTAGQYQLQAAAAAYGNCTAGASTRFGLVPNASRVVGLVGERYAVVVTQSVHPTVQLGMFELATGVELSSTDALPESSGYLDSIVVGTKSAILVTRDRPIFLGF